MNNCLLVYLWFFISWLSCMGICNWVIFGSGLVLSPSFSGNDFLFLQLFSVAITSDISYKHPRNQTTQSTTHTHTHTHTRIHTHTTPHHTTHSHSLFIALHCKSKRAAMFSVCLSVYLSVCYLSVCQPVSLSVCQPVSLSVCLSTVNILLTRVNWPSVLN